MSGKNINLMVKSWAIKDLQALPLGDDEMAIWWLGQAGFAVRACSNTLLIDPYLSDSLARKYAGSKFPHVRLVPVPVNPAALKGVDWVFCTHRHTDHMDPETLRLLAHNPNGRFFVPCATKEHAIETIGVDFIRTTCVNAGRSLKLGRRLCLHPIPSAHEKLQVNSRGEHYFLGYILQLGDIRIYHSGDCIPYDGIQNQLTNLKPDIALLPVNGCDEYRLSHNIPGNFHLEEALQLCHLTGIPYMIPHHFGMFEFNSVSYTDLKHKIKMSPYPVRILLPQVNKAYTFCRN